jgi:hypothetical protein
LISVQNAIGITHAESLPSANVRKPKSALDNPDLIDLGDKNILPENKLKIFAKNPNYCLKLLKFASIQRSH